MGAAKKKDKPVQEQEAVEVDTGTPTLANRVDVLQDQIGQLWELFLGDALPPPKKRIVMPPHIRKAVGVQNAHMARVALAAKRHGMTKEEWMSLYGEAEELPTDARQEDLPGIGKKASTRAKEKARAAAEKKTTKRR